MRHAFALGLLGLVLAAACSQSGDGGSPRGDGGSSGESANGGASPETGGAGGAEPSEPQPLNWDAAFRVTRAVDENPEPQVFETHLTAAVTRLEILPGLFSEVYTYGGTIPGPEIRVARGDRVIIHFDNQLPEDTTIHWHGLRVPNDVDGVPGVTQDPVGPGGTFTYDFVVRDAGTFWYHPHVRSAAQVGFGLYGSFVVTDPDEPEDLGDDLTIVLSDMSLDDAGVLLPADAGTRVDTIFGREGNVLLVNGKVEPVLHARSGRRQRWRIINAARSRYFELGIERQSFLRFAGDGGMIEQPVPMETVIIIPAERAEVIFDPEAAPGTQLEARWIPTDRGFGSVFAREEVPLFHIEMDERSAFQDAPLPKLHREIVPTDVTGATPVSLEMTLSNDDPDAPFFMGINGVPYWEADPIQAMIGETQIWTLTNATDFAHPFHLHGYFFQVLSVDGAPPAVREWKDTVDIHVKGETRIAINFDERPGMWMTHCHILDHAEAGMMTMVEVTDSSDGGAAGAPAH